MKQVFIKPNDGRRPRHYHTTQPIVEAGELVTDGPWVRRMLRTGDVLLFVNESTPLPKQKLEPAEKVAYDLFIKQRNADKRTDGDFVLFSPVINACLSKGYLAVTQPVIAESEKPAKVAKKSAAKTRTATH